MSCCSLLLLWYNLHIRNNYARTGFLMVLEEKESESPGMVIFDFKKNSDTQNHGKR